VGAILWHWQFLCYKEKEVASPTPSYHHRALHMSIHLARKTPSPKDSPPLFHAKKLAGYAPSIISTLGVIDKACFPEAAYGMYRTFVDAFCYATKAGETVFAQSEAFDNVYLLKITLPLELPEVSFSPTKALTVDQATALLQTLPRGSSMKAIGKTFEFAAPSPSISLMPKFLAADSQTHTCPPGLLSSAGFQAFVKTASVIELFLATNTYPAFKDLQSEIPQGRPMTFGVSGNNGEDGKTYFYSYGSDLKRDSDGLAKYNTVLKRRKLAEGSSTSTDSMEIEQEEVLRPEGNAVFSVSDPWINSSVVHAKPSGSTAATNFGPPGSCPNLPGMSLSPVILTNKSGLLFPYFRGMTRPDSGLIKEIMITSFFRLFGKDVDSCKKETASLSRGFNNLASTEIGMEIAHILKGIELALSTQTRLFLLFENGYKGFTLLGGRFLVFSGKWIAPVSAEDLKKEMILLDTHGANLAYIAEQLSALKVGNGAPSPVSASALDSAAAVMAAIRIRDFSSIAKPDDLDNALRGLVWPAPYTQINPDTFCSFLDSFFSSEELPSASTSMFIPTFKAPVGSRLFQWLSTFGPDAPSLWNTRSATIISVIEDKARKGKDKEPAELTIPNEIIILPKPLLVAVQDWEKILATGAVSFNFKERAKEYRAHVVKSDGVRKKIWETLKKGLEAVDRESRDVEKKKAKKDAPSAPVVEIDDLMRLF